MVTKPQTMSETITYLGTEIDPRQIQFSNGQWSFKGAAGRKGYFVLAAEWCHWCKRLASAMKDARASYGFPSYYVQGDSGMGQQLMQAMGAQGFPSVYVIGLDGTLTPYKGDRSPQALGNALAAPQQGGGGGAPTSWLSALFGW